MIEQYIYAVTKELPRKLREKTSDELRRLIADRLKRMDNDFAEGEKIEQVLRELGDPKILADQYRGKERYLIGPKYFDRYLFVLKIVTLSILIGLSVAHGVAVLFSVGSLAEMLGGYIGSLVSALLQGAAWVTGIFALFEYNEVSLAEKSEDEVWDPSQLPKLPEEKAKISRGESVFSIVFITVFLTLFFFSPEVMGIYYYVGDSVDFIPLFDLEQLAIVRVLLFIVFTIEILVELIKIVKGRWTSTVAIIATVLNVISAILVIYVVSTRRIWNNEIAVRLEQYIPISFDRVILAVILGIIIVTIAESASALYKGFKYGRE